MYRTTHRLSNGKTRKKCNYLLTLLGKSFADIGQQATTTSEGIIHGCNNVLDHHSDSMAPSRPGGINTTRMDSVDDVFTTTPTTTVPDTNNNRSKMWRNRASDFYKELMGDQEYHDRCKGQFQNPVEYFPKTKLASTIFSLQSYLGLKAFFTKGRGSHASGVGGRGYAVVDPDPRFPADDFFTSGRRFNVRVRFANVRVKDDALLDGRSISIKFQDSDDKSPLDLVMETGQIAPFNNLAELKLVLYALAKGGETLKAHCLKKPFYYESLVELARRNPDSFANIHYYAQQNYSYTDKEGRKHIARFRCVPADDRPESGRVSEEQQKTIWNIGRLPGETRSATYLRDEMKGRLQNQVVDFRVQAQLYSWAEDLSQDVYNCSKAWNETHHPWMNIAHVVLNEPMSDEVTEQLRMNISHKPESLDFFGASSIYDYNSIPHARLKVYPVSYHMRRLRSSIPSIMLMTGAATAFYIAVVKLKVLS